MSLCCLSLHQLVKPQDTLSACVGLNKLTLPSRESGYTNLSYINSSCASFHMVSKSLFACHPSAQRYTVYAADSIVNTR